MPRGRPTKYTPEIADEICRRMSEGETLRGICREESMPPFQTVQGWARDNMQGFSGRYAQARELQGHAFAEKAVEFAEARTGDAQADRLAFDAARWFASKVLPKNYSDKVDHTHAGPDGGPMTFKWED